MNRFATTLGVYIVGMGIGSVSFRSRETETSDGRAFFFAETALALIGLSAPFLFVLCYHFSSSTVLLIVTHAVIFATGFFAGLELPILSSLSGRGHVHQGSDARVLASDYLGMFIASLIFPFVLYPVLGLVATLEAATLLNLIAATTTYFLSGWRSRAALALVLVLTSINIAALCYSSTLQHWLSIFYATSN